MKKTWQVCWRSERMNYQEIEASVPEEAYKQFSDLFGPIIKDLHPKFDFRYSYKFEDLVNNTLEDQLASLSDYSP